jgi:hypothetical protein
MKQPIKAGIKRRTKQKLDGGVHLLRPSGHPVFFGSAVAIRLNHDGGRPLFGVRLCARISRRMSASSRYSRCSRSSARICRISIVSSPITPTVGTNGYQCATKFRRAVGRSAGPVSRRDKALLARIPSQLKCLRVQNSMLFVPKLCLG